MANLDAALDTTFEVSELAGQVLIVDLPSEGETGFAVFEPLANQGDSGSSVELFLLSDTLAAGGDGSTTVLDWSVDGSGLLVLTDPVDTSVITIEQVGASSGIRSIRLTQGTEELMGSFLEPANGVEMDLTGDSGRTFDAQVTTGTDRLTFYPEGNLTRVSNGIVFQELWSLHESGSLLIIEGAATEIFLSVLVNGSLATGGDTITFATINFSGAPAPPVYELNEMILGTMVPAVFPDPSTAIPYDFTTSPGASSPADPVLEGLFTGVSVSGSFRYANWVPALFLLDGPPLTGTAVYPEAMLDLVGTANGLAFSDSIGFTSVGNERYEPLGFVDFLSSGIGMTLDNGFDIDNYRLLRIRWFWIETDTTPGDFLDSDLLPATLPSQAGRLALDFALISDPQTEVSVFFEGFTVTPSP